MKPLGNLDRTNALGHIGQLLRSRGWNLYGEPFDDHADPLRWQGVASKDGLLLVVSRTTDTPTLPHWPAHCPNPTGKNWHLECQGEIIASNTGVERCLGSEGAVAARQLLNRIMRKARKTLRALNLDILVAPDSPATNGQRRLLYQITRVANKGLPLSQAEANDLIRRAMAGEVIGSVILELLEERGDRG